MQLGQPQELQEFPDNTYRFSEISEELASKYMELERHLQHTNKLMENQRT